jgi:hypothetical protein
MKKPVNFWKAPTRDPRVLSWNVFRGGGRVVGKFRKCEKWKINKKMGTLGNLKKLGKIEENWKSWENFGKLSKFGNFPKWFILKEKLIQKLTMTNARKKWFIFSYPLQIVQEWPIATKKWFITCCKKKKVCERDFRN